MRTYTLKQTGKVPLTFEGEEMARIYGRYLYGRRWSNYHNLIVYRAMSGQYTVAVQYRADFPMDKPNDAVLVWKDWNSLGGNLSEGMIGHASPIPSMMRWQFPNDTTFACRTMKRFGNLFTL